VEYEKVAEAHVEYEKKVAEAHVEYEKSGGGTCGRVYPLPNGVVVYGSSTRNRVRGYQKSGTK
jgi:hypothetical protein